MLVARRDPFHSGAHDAPYAQDAAGGGTPRLTRTISMLQVIGSLLAIPVGLGSAYSIYRANFSVETTCQSLRADIISMIGKSVDASTRRMLVRRDVEKFEQSCGAIDPDATAAFKALLAADKPATAAIAPVAAPIPAAPAKDIVRKVEPHPLTAGKMPAAAWPGAERARREAGVSDTQWLDAVRQALVTHEARGAAAEAVKAPVAPAALPVLRPALREEAAVPANTPIIAAPAPVQAAPPMAPTLPPAAAIPAPAAVVAAPPTPRTDADHPVPPSTIPDPAEVATAEANDHRSRIRRWIAKIPLMGNVIDNGLP
jgi:hypothetical protein